VSHLSLLISATVLTGAAALRPVEISATSTPSDASCATNDDSSLLLLPSFMPLPVPNGLLGAP